MFFIQLIHLSFWTPSWLHNGTGRRCWFTELETDNTDLYTWCRIHTSRAYIVIKYWNTYFDKSSTHIVLFTNLYLHWETLCWQVCLMFAGDTWYWQVQVVLGISKCRLYLVLASAGRTWYWQVQVVLGIGKCRSYLVLASAGCTWYWQVQVVLGIGKCRLYLVFIGKCRLYLVLASAGCTWYWHVQYH